MSDANSCSLQDAVVVTVNPQISVEAGPNKDICYGSGISLNGSASGGTAPLGFSWSPSYAISDTSILNPFVDPLVLTWYLLTVEDANGCIKKDSVRIRPLPELFVSAGPDLFICYGTSKIIQTAVSGGSPGYTYNWSPTTGLNNSHAYRPTATPLVSTTYFLTVTDSRGCKGYDTVFVEVNPELLVSAGPDLPICKFDTILLSGSASGGTPPLSAIWVPATGVVTPTSPTTDFSPPISRIYMLKIIDSRGCTKNDGMWVRVDPLPTATIAGNNIICDGDTADIRIFLTGTPPWQVVYFDTISMTPDTISGIMTSPYSFSDNPDHTNIYYVLSVTDDNGCTNSGIDTAKVIVHPVASVAVGSLSGAFSTICHGDSIELILDLTGTAPWSFVYTDTTEQITYPVNGVVASPYSFWIHPQQTSEWFVVTVVDANSCNSLGTDSISVIVNPLPEGAWGNDTAICINDTAFLQMYLTGTPPWVVIVADTTTGIPDTTSGILSSPWIYPVDPAVSNQYVILEVTDGNLCVGVPNDTLTVIVNELPTAILSGDTLICYGDSAYVRIDFSGATPWSFVFSDTISGAGISYTNLEDDSIIIAVGPDHSNIYYVSAVGDSNTCSNVGTDTVVVEVNPPISVDAGLTQFICFADSATLSGAVSGGTAPYFWGWTPAGSLSDDSTQTPNASPVDTTIFYIEVTDVNSCFANDSVQIDVNPKITVSAGFDKYICFGDSVSLNGHVLGGTPGYIFLWTPVAGLSNPSIINPKASPAVTTTYYLEATDTEGCAVLDSVVVTVNPQINLWAGNDTIICYNTSATLQATVSGGAGGYNYLWSPTSGLNNNHILQPVANPLTSKTYCITVSDASGCQKSDCMQLFVNPKLIVSAGQDKFICYSDSIMLNGLIGGGTAPYSYSWSPVTGIGNPALLEPWVSPANTTNYTLTATDFRNCPGFDIVTVKVNPEILADAGTQKFICYGDTALIEGSVSGGTSPYAISWMPADGLNNTHVIQPNANPDTTTFYSLFVTDTKGCHDTDTVTVIVNPEIFYSAGPDLFICFGDSITISGSASGGDAPFDYSWSPASGLADPSAIVVNASPGVSTSYTLEITDDSGCVKSDVMFLDVNPQLVLDAGPDTFICYGQSFLQPASISGGTQPYSYYWMPLVGLSSPLILQPVFYPNQSRTYYLNVFDINGCQIADSFAVSVNPAISVTACPDRFICFGDSVQISATPSGGSAPYSFSWTPAAPLSTPDSQSTCASPTDTTLFSVLLTDDEGCTASDNMVVGVNPEIFPDAGPDLFICFGDSITFGSSASGGVSPLEFAWTPVAGLNDYSVLQPNASPNSSHDYILTVSDANSCFDKDTMHLTVNPQLHLSAGPDLFICYGDSIAVTAIASGGSPEYSWQWTPSTAISVDTTPDMIAFPLDTTIFSVLLTDSMNCQISDTIEIIVNPQLFVSAGVDLFICYGDSTSFVPSVSGGNGVYEYLWMPSAGLFETDVFAPSASPIDTTEYLFSVSDSNGCVLTDTATIYVNPQLFLNAGTDLFICFADSIQISATASGGYGNLITVWTPDIGLSDDSVLSPTVSPQFSQVYVIDVLDESLCAISDTVSVEVNPELAVDAGFEHFLCYGDSFLLQPDIVGGTLPYAILWSPSTGLSDTSIMQPSAIPLDSTIYSIYVVDGNACSVSDSVAIGVNPEFHAHTSFDEFMCFGDSVPISCWGSGGVLPYIYNWSPASSLDNASIPNPTTGAQSTTVFTISLIDSSGCQATDSIVVAVNPPIFPDAGPDLFLCYLDSLLLEASVVGGTGPYYLYEWSPAAGMNDTSLLQPTVAPDSSTTYYVFISDDNSCGKYDSVHVFVNPPILLSAGPDLFKCYFDSILIAATISGGSPPYLYNWSPATGLSDTAILQPVSGVFDTIMYIVSATDSVGCQAVDTMNLVVNPEILVDAGEDIFLCFMQQDTLHGTAQGGVGQFAGYLWQPVAGIFDTTALNTMVMPDTTTNYTLTATDTNGCYYSDTVLVFVNTPVIPDAGDEITMCYLDTVVFGASVTGGLSPYYYAWTPSQFVQDSTILMASASPPVSYAFTLFVADSLGCSGSDNTLVWVNPLPIISVVAEKDTVCPDEPIEIEASGAVSYQWTPVLPLNQDTGSVVIASIGTETIFTVTGTDINGCINDTTDTVSVFPQLSILSLSANPYTICNGDSVWIEVELSGGNGGPFFFDWN
ncbi:MAG: hypothetical protein KKA07_03210 [Bacteroidetes bacterium]|nr:hypothetical protein [Bacteroidota bacterium]